MQLLCLSVTNVPSPASNTWHIKGTWYPCTGGKKNQFALKPTSYLLITTFHSGKICKPMHKIHLNWAAIIQEAPLYGAEMNMIKFCSLNPHGQDLRRLAYLIVVAKRDCESFDYCEEEKLKRRSDPKTRLSLALSIPLFPLKDWIRGNSPQGGIFWNSALESMI